MTKCYGLFLKTISESLSIVQRTCQLIGAKTVVYGLLVNIKSCVLIPISDILQSKGWKHWYSLGNNFCQDSLGDPLDELCIDFCDLSLKRYK